MVKYITYAGAMSQNLINNVSVMAKSSKINFFFSKHSKPKWNYGMKFDNAIISGADKIHVT